MWSLLNLIQSITVFFFSIANRDSHCHYSNQLSYRVNSPCVYILFRHLPPSPTLSVRRLESGCVCSLICWFAQLLCLWVFFLATWLLLHPLGANSRVMLKCCKGAIQTSIIFLKSRRVWWQVICGKCELLVCSLDVAFVSGFQAVASSKFHYINWFARFEE